MSLRQLVRTAGYLGWKTSSSAGGFHVFKTCPAPSPRGHSRLGNLKAHHTNLLHHHDHHRVFSSSSKSSSKPAYQYHPLGENESRLLLLHPGQPSEPLRCSLENLKTIKKPEKKPYKAISYSWGEVSGTERIECDGARLEITRSAHNVLRRLRDAEKTERVWIDGVCINQHDAAEKEKVVKRMRDIYGSASEVIIWLGEPEESHPERFMDDYLRWKESKKLGTPYGFISLLGRGWFTRKWILQEAVLAKPDALTVACGPDAIPWDGKDGFAEFLLDLKMGLHVGKVPEGERIQEAIRTVRFIDENRTRERPLPSSLFHVLLRTRYTDASNMTDYVAAVLGLAHDWNADCGLSPRYDNPGGQDSDATKHREFINFATWDVTANRSIRVLAYASGPDKEAGGLPSWVPDWTVKDRPEPLSTYTSLFSSLWCYVRVSKLLLEFGSKDDVGKVRLSAQGNALLEVEGITIDTVGAVTAPAPKEFSRSRLRVEYKEEAAARREVAEWFRQCLALVVNSSHADTIHLSREDLGRFASALSFRLHSNGSSEVLHFQHSTCLDRTVASYLQQITGRAYCAQLKREYTLSWTSDDVGQVEEPLRRWAVGRRFCRTRSGRLGFVPADAETGDKICVIKGHGAAYVLREHGDKHVAVGECSFDGLSATSDDEVRRLRREHFVLM
ncbi:heterokaryon incompatibility protein-domain-containing protein [Cladorrhinum sp. PSN332]|nr:heterokaryon incompatibility protein-domain-containing protein [Cladorrhinum sp. PSN332]